MARVPIQITLVDDRNLAKFRNAIGALGETRARVAIARALNRAARTAYTQVTRAIQIQTSAPRAVVREQVRLKLAAWEGDSTLEAAIWSRGKELPLADFRPKQFGYGVRAKVWGRQQQFRHAFIFAGNWKSGDAIAGESPRFHVFVRNGKIPKGGTRPNSFAELFGPSLPKELVKDETAKTFQRVASAELEKRLRYELNRMLGI